MKNKLRKITVDGNEYVWTVTNYNGDGDGGFALRVFPKESKIPIIDEFLNGIETTKAISPKIIEEKIKKLLTLEMILAKAFEQTKFENDKI